MTRARAVWERVRWPLAALVPALAATAGMWSSQRLYYFRDSFALFYPYHVWFRRQVEAGVFPLWDVSPAFGQSAIADPLRQILFPPALLARLIPDDVLGYNLFYGSALIVLATGTYVMLRPAVSREAAALGAVLLSVSSPALSTLNMPNLSWTLALGPWTVAALARLVERPSRVRLAAAAAAVALLVLAGEPVAGIGMMGAGLAVALFAPRDGAAWLPRRLGLLAAARAWGLALAAVQLLPAIAALGAARRSDPAVLDYLSWSMHPLRLLEAVVPVPYGNGAMLAPQLVPWMHTLNWGREPFLLSLYVGAGMLALAAVGAAAGPRRPVAVWAAVGLVWLVLAAGVYGGLLPLLIQIAPPLKVLRIPEKHVLTTTLALAALAAYGWDAVRAKGL